MRYDCVEFLDEFPKHLRFFSLYRRDSGSGGPECIYCVFMKFPNHPGCTFLYRGDFEGGSLECIDCVFIKFPEHASRFRGSHIYVSV